MLTMCCSAYIYAGQYVYHKGTTTYEVKEYHDEYMVLCFKKGLSSTSRNKNITDRQLRLDAMDLIGSYIVFKNEYSHFQPRYFQIVVDGIKLHYKALVEDVKQEYKNIDGKSVLCYVCPKNKYQINSTSYIRDLDLLSMIETNYERMKNEETANLFYEYEEFNSSHYIQLQEDFHKGNAVIPIGVRTQLQIEDRFERSIYVDNKEQGKQIIQNYEDDIPKTEPYKRFYLEELVTSLTLDNKTEYYQEWKESLQSAKTVWEDVLYYCSKIIDTKIDKNNICFSNVIESYCGAISPYGIRQPIDDEMYRQAVNAYSNSNFEESMRILRESIDIEGISALSLNLLGASCRFLHKSKEAIPFLILCFKLNPKTQYLVGNIALCLKMIGYSRMDEVCDFLLNYAVDEWSKNEIANLKKH